MTVYVVRHGESESNVQGKWGGRYNTALTPKGLEQAKLLTANLPDVHFEAIVASSLTRARQTAEVIKEALGIPLVLSDDFLERNMGVYEGLTKEEIIEKYPDLWERNVTRQLNDAPTNGETYQQFFDRITRALQKLKADYPNQNVILVTHFFVSRVINWYCTRISFEEMHNYSPANCEIAKYTL